MSETSKSKIAALSRSRPHPLFNRKLNWERWRDEFESRPVCDPDF